MKILIGTPAYNQALTVQYHESILMLFKHFGKTHPDVQFETCIRSLSLLNKMRNAMASFVLHDKSFTHLLFIDGDMGFQPSLIEEMIAVDKPIVGTIYPYRMLDVAKMHEVSQYIEDPTIAWMTAQGYICANSVFISQKLVDGQKEVTMDIEKGCVRAKVAGTGIMLIKREVFEIMRDTFPELVLTKDNSVYPSMGLESGILQVFEPLVDEKGLWLPEDISFCTRWTKGCKGEIWAHINAVIAHVGPAVFAGHFLTKFQNSRY